MSSSNSEGMRVVPVLGFTHEETIKTVFFTTDGQSRSALVARTLMEFQREDSRVQVLTIGKGHRWDLDARRHLLRVALLDGTSSEAIQRRGNKHFSIEKPAASDPSWSICADYCIRLVESTRYSHVRSIALELHARFEYIRSERQYALNCKKKIIPA